MVTWDFIESNGLLNLMVRERATNKLVPLPWFHFFMITFSKVGGNLALLLFSSVMGIVIYMFALYHLFLVARNTTTAETFKWDDIKQDKKYAIRTLKQIEEGKLPTTKEDEDSPKQEIYYFGGKASMEMRKRIGTRVGVDIAEYSIEYEEYEKKNGKKKAPVFRSDAEDSIIPAEQINQIFLDELQRLKDLKLKNQYDRGLK
eukprot:CAMPEP_0174272444 /NCGR_PEP_ID=MMETSP0439-20130205/51288_1 /TAXON_ID=0 /ORGANISM="Stereomyxa ramosa, Strain Chinc5" /LENGTH=201 /DNA_ID=CAMNT_0015363021 /DNA_START=631 /DNA_END=1233 /DNA_ORIENTATION=-